MSECQLRLAVGWKVLQIVSALSGGAVLGACPLSLGKVVEWAAKDGSWPRWYFSNGVQEAVLLVRLWISSVGGVPLPPHLPRST